MTAFHAEIFIVLILSFQYRPVLGTPNHMGISRFASVFGYNSADRLCATDLPMLSTQVQNLESCSWNCIVYQLCENFNFNNVTGQCDLYFNKPKNYSIVPAGCLQYQLVKRKARDCDDLLADGFRLSGVYVIYPDPQQQNKLTVYCDMDTSPGRACTVFARSTDNTISFNVGWDMFMHGFGNPSREFWFGNEMLHSLTSQRRYSMRLDMAYSGGYSCFAQYSNFSVGSKNLSYQLTIDGYSGNCTTVPLPGVNLAIGKPAYQSSTAYSRYSANKAVDGNANTNAQLNFCSITNTDGKNWLVVDLGTSVFVQYVAVTNRADCCVDLLSNFIVGVSDVYNGIVALNTYPICGQYPGPSISGARMIVKCKIGTPCGRYVIIQLPAGSAGPLNICELEVFTYDQISSSNTMAFSTFDSDRDLSNVSCSSLLKTGFWFNNCNGFVPTPIGEKKAWNSNPLKFSEMKLCPVK